MPVAAGMVSSSLAMSDKLGFENTVGEAWPEVAGLVALMLLALGEAFRQGLVMREENELTV